MAFDLQNVHDSVKGYKHKYIYFFYYVGHLDWFKLIEDLRRPLAGTQSYVIIELSTFVVSLTE